MTDKASPDQPGGGPRGRPQERTGEGQDLARFLQDWTALWQRELLAQSGDPPEGVAKGGDMGAAAERWRSAMSPWTDALIGSLKGSPIAAAFTGDHAPTPRAEAAAVAPDARDAEIGRLTRRVDELEARLAKLETTRRGRR